MAQLHGRCVILCSCHIMLILGFQFINNGIHCMKEILTSFSASNELQELPGCIERAGHLLRVLARVAESNREEVLDICQLDPSIQNEFIDVVSSKLSELEAALTVYHSDPKATVDGSPLAGSIIFLCRLLHFDLSLRGAWTTSTRMQTAGLVPVLSRIALVCSNELFFYAFTDTVMNSSTALAVI